MVTVTVMMVMRVLLQLLFVATFFNDLDVVVEHSGNDWHRAGLDYPGAHRLGASHTNIHNTLEAKVPFPHVHHVLAPTLLQNTDQSLDAAIDGEDVSYAGR